MPVVFLLFLQSRRVTDYDEQDSSRDIWHYYGGAALSDPICRCKCTGCPARGRAVIWRRIWKWRIFWRCFRRGCAISRESCEWIYRKWIWSGWLWWRKYGEFFRGRWRSDSERDAGACAECAGWRRHHCKIKYIAGSGKRPCNRWKTMQSDYSAGELHTYRNPSYVQQHLSVRRRCHDNENFTEKRDFTSSGRQSDIRRRVWWISQYNNRWRYLGCKLWIGGKQRRIWWFCRFQNRTCYKCHNKECYIS